MEATLLHGNVSTNVKYTKQISPAHFWGSHVLYSGKTQYFFLLWFWRRKEIGNAVSPIRRLGNTSQEPLVRGTIEIQDKGRDLNKDESQKRLLQMERSDNKTPHVESLVKDLTLRWENVGETILNLFLVQTYLSSLVAKKEEAKINLRLTFSVRSRKSCWQQSKMIDVENCLQWRVPVARFILMDAESDGSFYLKHTISVKMCNIKGIIRAVM